MGLSQFDERVAVTNGVELLLANGLTTVPVMVGSGAGSHIDLLLAANSDAIDHVVIIYTDASSVPTPIGSVNVPAGAGWTALSAVDLLAAIVPPYQTGLMVQPTVGLYVSVVPAMVGAAALDVTCFFGQV
jgi:hypothetical protein